MFGRLQVPVFPGVLAVSVGMAITLFGSSIFGPAAGLITMALSLFVLYFLAGTIMGFGWPGPSWAWGVWVALPFTLLIMLSLAFAGQIGAFLQHDLMPVAGAIAGGLLGGAMGANVRGRVVRPHNPTGA